MNTLKDFPPGTTVTIKKLKAEGSLRRRLMDLGFLEGTSIKIVRRSPIGDPTVYKVRGSFIALRKEEASQIITN